jgi:hypothetical protein
LDLLVVASCTAAAIACDSIPTFTFPEILVDELLKLVLLEGLPPEAYISSDSSLITHEHVTDVSLYYIVSPSPHVIIQLLSDPIVQDGMILIWRN